MDQGLHMALRTLASTHQHPALITAQESTKTLQKQGYKEKKNKKTTENKKKQINMPVQNDKTKSKSTQNRKQI